MPHKSGIQFIPASTRRRATANQISLDDLFPEQFMPIIETSVIYKMSKQLDSRLCSFLFQLRQVNVVNKHNISLVGPSSKQCFTFLVQLWFYCELSILRFSFGREVQENSCEMVLFLFE